MAARSLPTFLFSMVLVGLSCYERLIANDPPPIQAHPKRILLLGQKADTHPKGTHEYMAGIRLIARLLQDRGNLQVIIVQADNPWTEGPELLDGADGVLLFLTEGAKWISDDAERLTAFKRLATRGGGLSCLHWGMGTKEAAPVADFVSLFGGCHGGPDRKFTVADLRLVPSSTPHPIISGIPPIVVHDEVYYSLKFPASAEGHRKLLNADLTTGDAAVAWAWERPGGGRSFGFTGLHFHETWKRSEYRRLVVQGILWTVSQSIPNEGVSVAVRDEDLLLPDPK